MLNPFDSEFLSQELRETWKKVEELEKENKELKDELLRNKRYIDYLEEKAYSSTNLMIGDRHEMGG